MVVNSVITVLLYKYLKFEFDRKLISGEKKLQITNELVDTKS